MPTRLVGADLDSTLARQDRAKKALVLAEQQLAATQQKEKEARKELCLAETAAHDFRQSAMQGTLLFDDAVQHKSRTAPWRSVAQERSVQCLQN